MSKHHCKVCASRQFPLFQSYDDRYGYPGEFELQKCKGCGHIWLNQEFTAKEITNLYTNYYPRKAYNVEIYKPYVEQNSFINWFNGLKASAFRWVPRNVKVLDIGCGFGQSLGYHEARGCDAYGVEADENIQRVIDKFGYKVHVGLFGEHIYEPNFFDCITMDQAIEHVADPLSTLRDIEKILKPGGLVVFSTPNANGWGPRVFGKRWINWHTPYHLQFFSRRSIEIAAEHAGMKLEKCLTVTNSEWLFYQCLHLLSYPKQGESSTFWLPTKKKSTFFKKVIVRLFQLTHRLKINHLITRLFDSLGQGDNFVFVLKKHDNNN